MGVKTCETCGNSVQYSAFLCYDTKHHQAGFHNCHHDCDYWTERTDDLKRIALDMLDSYCRSVSEDGCAYMRKGLSRVYIGVSGCENKSCIVNKYADRLRALGIEVPE